MSGPRRRGVPGTASPDAPRIRVVEHVVVPSVVEVQGAELSDCYEVYEAGSAAQAQAFLADIEITRPRYYVVVETPEGIFGRDYHGGYAPSRTWRGNLNEWNRNRIPVRRITTRLMAASEAIELERFAEAAAVLRPIARLPMVEKFVQAAIDSAQGTISPEERESLPELMRAYASQYQGKR